MGLQADNSAAKIRNEIAANFLTRQELKDALGIGDRALKRIQDNKHLRFLKHKKRHLVHRHEVIRYLNSYTEDEQWATC